MPLAFRTWLVAVGIGLLFFNFPKMLHAFMGSIETELGYDSNPSLVSSDEKDSSFTILSGVLSQGFTPSSHTILTMAVQGMGRQYLRGGEHESIVNLHSDLTYVSHDGTFQPTLFTRASFYRSDLVPEDDRDVVGLGASIAYYPRLGLGISLGISFDWLDFRRPYTLTGSRGIQDGITGLGQMVSTLGTLSSISGLKSSLSTRLPSHQGAMWMGKPPHDSYPPGDHRPPFDQFYFSDESRNDRYESIYFSMEKDLAQHITASILLTRERLFSSIKYESFTRYGTTGDITLTLPKNLDLITTFSWKRAVFRKTSLGNRTDYLKYVSIELIKSYEKFGISVGYEHILNDSSFEIEDYRKNLVRIKFGFYF